MKGWATSVMRHDYNTLFTFFPSEMRMAPLQLNAQTHDHFYFSYVLAYCTERIRIGWHASINYINCALTNRGKEGEKKKEGKRIYFGGAQWKWRGLVPTERINTLTRKCK